MSQSEDRRWRLIWRKRSSPWIDSSGGLASVPIRFANVVAVLRVQCRWQAYFGCDVMIYWALQRGDGGNVAPERDLGVAIMATVWVLDTSICKTMTVGSPVVSFPPLLDLQEILRLRRFRRSFGEDDSSKEAGVSDALATRWYSINTNRIFKWRKDTRFRFLWDLPSHDCGANQLSHFFSQIFGHFRIGYWYDILDQLKYRAWRRAGLCH